MTGLMVVSAWCLGILNTHRRFFLPYAAPALWNIAGIAAMVGAAAWLRGKDSTDCRSRWLGGPWPAACCRSQFNFPPVGVYCRAFLCESASRPKECDR